MPSQPHYYFKGLNGLRFFAAMFVVIYHASTFVTAVSAPAVYDTRSYSFFNNGSTAVDFFFVLSGFLIATLLLNEFADSGNINIKHFYTRRALRIWPLYYFAVLLVFAVFPGIAMFTGIEFPATGFLQFLLYLFMLPNLTPFVQGGGLLSPLWSIGVEEQFYFMVAPLIKHRRQKLAIILCWVIVLKILLNIVAEYFLKESHHDLAYFILTFRFEVISIGCLGALLIRSSYKNYLYLFFSYSFQLCMFILLLLILLFNKSIPEAGIPYISSIYVFLFSSAWSGVITGCIFLYIILNVSLNEKSILKTNNRLLDTLGDISYGIYVYHVIAELAILKLFKNFFAGTQSIFVTCTYYFASALLAMAAAYVSYHLLEKRFLKLKYKFAAVGQ